MQRQPGARTNEELHERLRSRREEIEAAILARVRSVPTEQGGESHEYAEGLRDAIAAALEHAIAAIELGEERCPPPPPGLLSQARLAAASGVQIDAVYRRYFAAQALITDFLITEAHSQGTPPTSLKRSLHAQAAVFDRVLLAIAKEHSRESQRRLRTQSQRQTERIERLLAGELPDTSELAYDLEAHHLSLIASGRGASHAIRDLTAQLDRRLLILERSDAQTWAWLGGREPLDPSTLRHRLKARTKGLSISLGEPAKGLAGWRLTHRQAKAAFRIAQCGPEPIVRYAEVALFASAIQDELLVSSLRTLYLQPLAKDKDGGKTARETLSAYFQTGRNISSAAALLGVSRRTVANRLRAAEGLLGRSLLSCAAELEVALGIWEVRGRVHSEGTN
jgi:PucR C-terminal helix-turn-helix domain/GGDEF-like domain